MDNSCGSVDLLNSESFFVMIGIKKVLVTSGRLLGLLLLCPIVLATCIDASVGSVAGISSQDPLAVGELWGGSGYGYECIANPGAGGACPADAGPSPGGKPCKAGDLDFNFCKGGASNEHCSAKVLAHCDDDKPVATCPHDGYHCDGNTWQNVGPDLVTNTARCGTRTDCD